MAGNSFNKVVRVKKVGGARANHCDIKSESKSCG